MPIEQNVQYIDDLNATNPPATDPLSQVDDHLRLIKTAVKQSFPNVTGAVTATHTVLNGLDGRVTAVEGRDLTAIKNNSGTPELVTGITATEVRDAIGLGMSNNVFFNEVHTSDLYMHGSNWSIETSGTDLLIKYNGVNKVKISSNGAIRSTDDIIAEATI